MSFKKTQTTLTVMADKDYETVGILEIGYSISISPMGTIACSSLEEMKEAKYQLKRQEAKDIIDFLAIHLPSDTYAELGYLFTKNRPPQ